MSSGTGGVWQRAVEQAARTAWEAKAVPMRTPVSYGFDDIVPSTRQWYIDNAEAVLAAAWPLLRDALVEEVRKQNTVDRDSAHEFGPYTCGVHDGIDRAADVVARFTPEAEQ